MLFDGFEILACHITIVFMNSVFAKNGRVETVLLYGFVRTAQSRVREVFQRVCESRLKTVSELLTTSLNKI
jgi:hypothetical protein